MRPWATSSATTVMIVATGIHTGLSVAYSLILVFALVAVLGAVLWSRTPEQRLLEDTARNGD